MSVSRLVFPMVLLFVLLFGQAQVQGQEAGDPELARVADELAALNRTMGELAELLKVSLERSELNLFLKRLEMAQRAIAPREGKLESARAELDSLNEQASHVQTALDEIHQLARDATKPGSGVTADDVQQQRQELERHLQFLKDRVRATQQRIIDLENELATERRAIAFWQDEIDHRLGVR